MIDRVADSEDLSSSEHSWTHDRIAGGYSSLFASNLNIGKVRTYSIPLSYNIIVSDAVLEPGFAQLLSLVLLPANSGQISLAAVNSKW